ncbi:tRNA (adenine-N1)-methyltransferase [Candidatus Woesearchaeota archaeon]|nr:tRNA (adenine-N1)-methyltransferase [Candidatus Woesearchaeota archaeon]
MRLLISQDNQSYLLRDITKDFHTKHGFLKATEIKKAKDGQTLTTNLGYKFIVLSPTFADLFSKIDRGPQIITPKDIGTIAAYTGIGKDSFVVDAGSGSGALCCFIAHLAKKVVTYENDSRSVEVTKKNIQLLGLKNIKLKQADVYQGIEEKNVDVITLDLPEPWKCLEHAHKALKPGGFLVSYSPHITQILQLVNQATALGFTHMKTQETIERQWVVEGQRARPEYQMLGHTGFLAFFRKV